MSELVEQTRPFLIGVVGHQRGGTTGFRQYLGSGPSAIDLGEIFSGHIGDFTNFWRFLLRAAKTRPEWICPHFWYEAWESYIQEQAKLLNASRLVFDLKLDVLPFVYRHVAYSAPHRSEFFFSWSQVKLIHLERRNALAQIISRVRAERSGNWGVAAPDLPCEQYFRMSVRQRGYDSYVLSAFTENVPAWIRDGGMGEDPELFAGHEWSTGYDTGRQCSEICQEERTGALAPIDPDWLVQEVEAVLEANRFAWNALLPLGPLKVYYEDLYRHDCTLFAPEVERICAFVGIDPSSLSDRPLSQKLAPRNFIAPFANADEIMRRFSATEHAWMLPQDEEVVSDFASHGH